MRDNASEQIFVTENWLPFHHCRDKEERERRVFQMVHIWYICVTVGWCIASEGLKHYRLRSVLENAITWSCMFGGKKEILHGIPHGYYKSGIISALSSCRTTEFKCKNLSYFSPHFFFQNSISKSAINFCDTNWFWFSFFWINLFGSHLPSNWESKNSQKISSFSGFRNIENFMWNYMKLRPLFYIFRYL